MPVERPPLGHLDPRLLVVLVEQAQLDGLGVLGEDREVGSAAVPVRAQRERPTRPHLGHRIRAPDSGSSSTWPSANGGCREWPGGRRPAHGTRRGWQAKLHASSNPPRPTRSHRSLLIERDPPASPGVSSRRACKQLDVERGDRRVALAARASSARTSRWPGGPGSPPRTARTPLNSSRRPSRVACGDLARRCDRRRTETAPCSPYSSPMNSIGTNGESSVQNAASGRASAGIRSPRRAVADLVVVLGEDHEPLRREVIRRRAEAAAAKARVAAVVDVRAVKRLGELRDGPKSS